jgi:hypothetical protein
MSNISGYQGQMTYLFSPLMRNEYGWNASSRKMKFGGSYGISKAIRPLGLMDLLWHFFNMLGTLKD